jgi:UDP-glucose 4-epimerase
MRALVTGGAGFVGSHVTEALLQAGAEVVVLDNLASGSRDNLAAGAEFVLADITDTHAVTTLIRGLSSDVVVHLAAATEVAASMNDPAHDAVVNVVGTLSVLQAAMTNGCRKFVFASSSTVYGEPTRQPVHETDPLRPISPYGASKVAGEHYVRIVGELHRAPYTILRLGNVFGPRDTPRSHHVVTMFLDALVSGQRPAIDWDGEQTKDYVYVADVAAAVLRAIEHGDNDVFNVGSGTGTTVNEIFGLVCSVMDTRVTPEHRSRRAGDVRQVIMDCSKAHDVLGWRPDTPFEDGLRRTAEALAARPAVEASSQTVATGPQRCFPGR